jgi:hypothetical protein
MSAFLFTKMVPSVPFDSKNNYELNPGQGANDLREPEFTGLMAAQREPFH